MNDTVSTKHAGETKPQSSFSARNGYIASIVVFALLAPVAVASAAATWITFSYFKIKRTVILAFLLAYLILLGWAIPYFAVPQIVEKTFNFIVEMFDSSVDWGALLILSVSHIIVGIPLGVAVGLLYSSWRWYRRPIWRKVEFKPTPWEMWKGKKTIKQIQNDDNSPFDGLTLGVNDKGERVVQTDSAAAAHTLIVGASGSGKTTTLMSKARDAIKRGHGVVFVDLKGGKDVPQILHNYSKRYGREFKQWLIQPLETTYSGPDGRGPACYDPLSRGDATRRKDLLIASREWSEEFYKIEASNYLQLLFHTIILNPKVEISTLSDVVSMLSPQALLNRAEKIMESNPEYKDILSGIEALNDPRISQAKRNAIEGLRSQLEVILNSAAGRWLLVDPEGNNINIKKAAHEGQVIVFSLDSSNYPELASLLANLIIQDLKTVSSELRDDPAPNPTQIFIDEFSAIGSENIIGLVNKSRDAGLPVTLSTQALGDLRRVNASFLDQLLGIINSFIIHRANKDDDAEVYAGLTGTEKKVRFAQSVEMSVGRLGGIGKGSGTGSGRVEEYEDFIVTPNEIQELDMGEIIYVTKAPNMVEKATVVPEKFAEEAIKDDEEVEYYQAWGEPEVVTPEMVQNQPYSVPEVGSITIPHGEEKLNNISTPQYLPEEELPTRQTLPTVNPTPTLPARPKNIAGTDMSSLPPINNPNVAKIIQQREISEETNEPETTNTEAGQEAENRTPTTPKPIVKKKNDNDEFSF